MGYTTILYRAAYRDSAVPAATRVGDDRDTSQRITATVRATISARPPREAPPYTRHTGRARGAC